MSSSEISIDVTGRLVVVRLTGAPDLHDLLEIDRRLRALPDVERLQGLLADLRTADLDRLASADLRAYARQPTILAADSRRAIVVATDQAFGLARMFEQLYAEAASGVRVFRDADEARRWLTEPDPGSIPTAESGSQSRD